MAKEFRGPVKEGDKLWAVQVQKSNGCVLVSHTPPTEIEATIPMAIRDWDQSKLARTSKWPKKRPTYCHFLSLYKTKEEAVEAYQDLLRQVQKELGDEIARVVSYVKHYQGLIDNPTIVVPKASKKSNIQI